MTDVSNITGLDLEAWERWVAYRKAIRKPLKEISLHAAALKLAKYGADQSEVVSQSISNQWQGLFDLKKSKGLQDLGYQNHSKLYYHLHKQNFVQLFFCFDLESH